MLQTLGIGRTFRAQVVLGKPILDLRFGKHAVHESLPHACPMHVAEASFRTQGAPRRVQKIPGAMSTGRVAKTSSVDRHSAGVHSTMSLFPVVFAVLHGWTWIPSFRSSEIPCTQTLTPRDARWRCRTPAAELTWATGLRTQVV